MIEYVKSCAGAGNCVEVRLALDGSIEVRDSKHPDRGPLVFDQQEWSDFIDGVRRGTFDFVLASIAREM